MEDATNRLRGVQGGRQGVSGFNLASATGAGAGDTGVAMNNGADQLKREMQSLLRRYAGESDVTIAEAIGVIELVKAELIALAQDDGEPEPA